jgi:hypothetical protein
MIQKPNNKPSLRVDNDARIGMPFGIPKGAMCVQRFDDSLNSAIHITYRISLRSSSMPEPRDPLLKVLNVISFKDSDDMVKEEFEGAIGQQRARTRVPKDPGSSSPTEARQAGQSNKCHLNKGWEIGHQKVTQNSVMILPQVHLRKPCYDFYFL